MKTSIVYSLIALPLIAIVQARDISAVINNVAQQSAVQKNLIQKSLIDKMEKRFTDKLAAELILKQQGIKAIEYMRKVVSLPEVADQSKRFSLPSLQATLNVYVKGANYPVPEDIRNASKNGAKALEQIITIEEERRQRKATNPYAPQDSRRNSEEEKLLAQLKMQYDNYTKQAETLRLGKYGVDTQEFNRLITPIIANSMLKVSSTATNQEQKINALNALFDAMQKYW